MKERVRACIFCCVCFSSFAILLLTYASTISRFNGQDRLRDLLGPLAPVSVEKWAQAPGSTTFSFQHVVIPLLRVLTSDPIRKSVVQTWSNVLYAALHGMDCLELRLARFAQECLAQEPILLCRLPATGPLPEPGCGRQRLLPKSWSDIILPIARLLREVASRMEGAAAEDSFVEALRVLDTCVEDARTSSSSSSTSEGFKQVVDILDGVHFRVDTAMSRLRLGDERTAEAERQHLRETTHSRRRGTCFGVGCFPEYSQC